MRPLMPTHHLAYLPELYTLWTCIAGRAAAVISMPPHVDLRGVVSRVASVAGAGLCCRVRAFRAGWTDGSSDISFASWVPRPSWKSYCCRARRNLTCIVGPRGSRLNLSRMPGKFCQHLYERLLFDDVHEHWGNSHLQRSEIDSLWLILIIK